MSVSSLATDGVDDVRLRQRPFAMPESSSAGVARKPLRSSGPQAFKYKLWSLQEVHLAMLPRDVLELGHNVT